MHMPFDDGQQRQAEASKQATFLPLPAAPLIKPIELSIVYYTAQQRAHARTPQCLSRPSPFALALCSWIDASLISYSLLLASLFSFAEPPLRPYDHAYMHAYIYAPSDHNKIWLVVTSKSIYICS